MYKERLASIRNSLQEGDALILPRRDRFLNSSLLDQDADFIRWATGFTGSEATLIVTKQQAVVCIDGRYDAQADRELDPALFSKTRLSGAQWLAAQSQLTTLFFDPWLHAIHEIETLKNLLPIWTFKPCSPHPLEILWTDRPFLRTQPIVVCPMDRSFQEKACAVWPNGLDGPVLLCAGDQIAWLCNIRGSDFSNSPLFHGYALIVEDKQSFQATIFTNSFQVPSCCDICFVPLSGMDLPAEVTCDPKTTPYAFYKSDMKKKRSPLPQVRAHKTPYEVKEMRQAHVSDAIALVKFLYWLNTSALRTEQTEWSAAQKLEEYRQKDPTYRGKSFDTIAAIGANGAIVHYHPSCTGSAVLVPDLFLLDCGGHYGLGTTDVTRTMALGGSATQQQKEHFTLVLQAHCHLANIQFPKGTRGIHLDAAARSCLWQEGKDYPHSTGHGVGNYLSVHEYPPAISSRDDGLELSPGMIFSNEPGYYLPGCFGIRIESLVVVYEKGDTLALETLTLVPIDQALIMSEKLSREQKIWVDRYHQTVFEMLSPHLPCAVREWLYKETKPLS